VHGGPRLDGAVHEQERRITSLARDRARMQAILGSMVEGVLVVDEGGRLQLVNEAARLMLRIESDAVGRPYVEALRHPGVVEHVGRLLTGGAPQAFEFSTTRDASREPGPARPGGPAPAAAWCVLHDVTDLKRADHPPRLSPCPARCARRSRRSAATPRRSWTTRTIPCAAAVLRSSMARHAHGELVKDPLRLAMLDAGGALEMAPADIGALSGIGGHAAAADQTPAGHDRGRS
jgi:hypothetical protein